MARPPAILVAALVIAAGLLGYGIWKQTQPAAPAAPELPSSEPEDPAAGYVWAFQHGPMMDAGDTPPQLVVIGPADASPRPSSIGDANVSWLDGGRLGLLTPRLDERCPPTVICKTMPPPAPYVAWPLHDAPRFGQGGAFGVRFTLYAFEPDGDLYASNTPEADQDRFPFFSDPTTLPNETWWLGDGPAPNGTVLLPSLYRSIGPQLRAYLDGLPVGGVVTDTFSTSLTGTLVLTLRIDDIRPMPTP